MPSCELAFVGTSQIFESRLWNPTNFRSQKCFRFFRIPDAVGVHSTFLAGYWDGYTTYIDTGRFACGFVARRGPGGNRDDNVLQVRPSCSLHSSWGWKRPSESRQSPLSRG